MRKENYDMTTRRQFLQTGLFAAAATAFPGQMLFAQAAKKAVITLERVHNWFGMFCVGGVWHSSKTSINLLCETCRVNYLFLLFYSRAKANTL